SFRTCATGATQPIVPISFCNHNKTMKPTCFRRFGFWSTASVCLLAFVSLAATPADSKKIGVLLVSHGSRSETWRKSLLALEESVRPAILTNQSIAAIRTAFMEYTEPSIATRLKEFDAQNFTDVIVVPVFLTVSPHTFDDIPTIIGKKV